MNEVFFGCMTCRVLVNAGYRWATSTLEEPAIIARDRPVEPAAVTAAPDYWRPPDGADSLWLSEGVLPRVRNFLRAHGTHTLRFGDFEDLAGTEDTAFLDWLDVSVEPVVGPRRPRINSSEHSRPSANARSTPKNGPVSGSASPAPPKPVRTWLGTHHDAVVR